MSSFAKTDQIGIKVLNLDVSHFALFSKFGIGSPTIQNCFLRTMFPKNHQAKNPTPDEESVVELPQPKKLSLAEKLDRFKVWPSAVPSACIQTCVNEGGKDENSQLLITSER